MADLLWTCVFLGFSSHLVVSYPDRKCGPPMLYPGKVLDERYSGKQEFNDRDRVMYKCEFGYTTSRGSRSSHCQNGVWSPLELECKRKICGSAGEILNGRFIQTGNAFGDTAEAVCDPGYVLQGEPSRRCLGNGWSGDIPMCVVDDVTTLATTCPLLNKSNNATYHGRKDMYEPGETLSYTCNDGFQLIGNIDFLQCDRTGQWNPSHANCQKKTCGSPGEITNGRFIQTGNAFGDTAQAVCNPGYVLQGEPSRQCQDNGWSGNIPTCVVEDLPISCPLLNKSKNATYHGTKDMYRPGETLSYSCNDGFRFFGNRNFLQCDRTGKWNPSHANCKKIKCKKFTIHNGKVKIGHLIFNTKVNIACKNGFHLQGPSVVTCGANGSWTPALPTCERGSIEVVPLQVTCLPPAVPNSIIQPVHKTEYEVGEKASISCQAGFELIGSSWVTCGADGQWQEIAECRLAERSCQLPPNLANAHHDHFGHDEPKIAVRYKCNTGYRMVRGPSTIYCRNGRWTDLKMKCEKKKCGSAGEIPNGRYQYTGSSFGDNATARCNTGYQLVGKGVRHCRENGWDGREAVCEAIQCPEPEIAPGAELIFDTSGVITYGYMASYRCRFGKLVGPSDIYCTEDGTWSEPAPYCKDVLCPIPTVGHGLIISGWRARYQSGNSVTFNCNPGKRLLGPHIITCGENGQWHPRLPICFWYDFILLLM